MAEDKYKFWEVSLKSLTLIGLVAAGIFSYYTHIDTKEKEFYSKFWNTKFQVFSETSEAASQMATTSSCEDFNNARERFWKLYYGKFSLIEGATVAQAMIDFGSLVPVENDCSKIKLPLKKLWLPTYKLTTQLKKELVESWRDPFSEPTTPSPSSTNPIY